jgi:DNA integrity scanning protein DisA with diadenylate cyclase activity
MMIRKDTLLYKITQLHWFLLLTIIAMAMFGSLILFSAGSSAHDLETGLLKIDARYAMDHIFRFTIMRAMILRSRTGHRLRQSLLERAPALHALRNAGR